MILAPLCGMSLFPASASEEGAQEKKEGEQEVWWFDFGGVLTRWLKNPLGTMEMQVMDDDVLKF